MRAFSINKGRLLDFLPLIKLFAGLGLCYAGATLLTNNLRMLSGTSLHNLIRKGTNNRYLAAFWGIIINAIVNKTSAVASILASLVSTNMITLKNAISMCVWGNIGSIALLYIVTIRIDYLVFIVLGISGIWIAFAKEGFRKYLVGGIFGISLLLFGVFFMRSSVTVQEIESFSTFFQTLRQSPGIVIFIIGCLGEIVVQSSTMLIIILMQLMHENAINLDQVILFICGMRLISGLIVVLNNLHFTGVSRQLIYVQMLFNVIGCFVCLILYYLEKITGIPLVVGLIQTLSDDPIMQILNFCNYFNIITALIMTFGDSVLSIILRYMVNVDAIDPSKPMYIVNASKEDPYSCLSQSYKEQIRIMQEISDYIAYIRDMVEQKQSVGKREGLPPFYALNREVSVFLLSLQGNLYNRTLFQRYLNLISLVSVTDYIGETLVQFRVELYEQLKDQNNPLKELNRSMLETFDILNSTMLEAMKSQEEEDIMLVFRMTHDRGSLEEEFQQKFVKDYGDLDDILKEEFVALMKLYDRYVWLTQEVAECIKKEKEFGP